MFRKLTCISIMVAMLTGCATTKLIDYGTVTGHTKLKAANYGISSTDQVMTLTGALAGTVIGGAVGLGSSAGLAVGLLGFGLLMTPALVISSAAAGAVIGAAAFGGSSYIYGVYRYRR